MMTIEQSDILLTILNRLCPGKNKWCFKWNARDARKSFEIELEKDEYNTFFDRFERLIGCKFYTNTNADNLIVGITASTCRQTIVEKLIKEENMVNNTIKIDRFVKRISDNRMNKTAKNIHVLDNLRLSEISHYDYHEAIIFVASTPSDEVNNMLCDLVIEKLNNDESLINQMDQAYAVESDDE